MSRSEGLVVVDFPLRGEWMAPNTPGSKVPSHGTDALGSTFAYDFVQVDWNRPGNPSYKVSAAQYLAFGARLTDYYAYGQPVYAPCDGLVVAVGDGYAERPRAHVLTDGWKAIKSANQDLTTIEYAKVAGNFVIIRRSHGVFIGMAHFKPDSVLVAEDEMVQAGQPIAQVGHSGNSFGPHLHIQAMDNADPRAANGLPLAFTHYELYDYGLWHPVTKGIPKKTDRIRLAEVTS